MTRAEWERHARKIWEDAYARDTIHTMDVTRAVTGAVAMASAGARTSFDEEPAHELVDSALWELEQTMPVEWHSQEDLDTAIQAEHEATASATREEMLRDPEALAAEVDIDFLMRALEARLEIEREATRKAAEERGYERGYERGKRDAEIVADSKALEVASKPRKRRRKSSALADGGGS